MRAAARALALLLATAGPAQAADPAAFGATVRAAQARWVDSPHGPMLERILPPTFAPQQLPEPRSPGAALTVRYCVQCHNLPNPAMHHAEKWPKVVTRMVERMRGKGNMGVLMKDMMAGVEAPGAAEEAALVDYLKRTRKRRSIRGALRTRSSRWASRFGWPATSAMCCPIRSATPQGNGLRWSSACARTWNG